MVGLAHHAGEIFAPTLASSLSISLARNRCEIRETQRLRYRVFVKEMGAHLASPEFGLDRDGLDDFCQHLLVRDRGNGEVVGCCRILTDRQAANTGGFHSETEFDLKQVLVLPGRFMEVGRICTHPDYRQGAVLALLCSGLARFMVMTGTDHLIGCVNIPLGGEKIDALAALEQLQTRYFSPPYLRAMPKAPLSRADSARALGTGIPPLLRGYLRLGAQICGEPCLNQSFNAADVLVLLRRASIDRRYWRRFISPY
jgi:putative hemolysin